MTKSSKLEKIVEKIIETLIVGLVVGFFMFLYNQSKKVDKVDSKVEAGSLVDKTLTESISRNKSDIISLKNMVYKEYPFTGFQPEKSAEEVKEEIEQTIDKELYRAKELKR